VANLDEWARVAPLSATEYRLLQNYNEKPVLTRPQQVGGSCRPGRNRNPAFEPKIRNPHTPHPPCCPVVNDTRVQAFHVGPNYLEVDLDVHNYAFLARKALWSYHDRIPTVVWDMGFVIQVRGCVCS
jgi:hypothetical protein